jgi:hypothetical protein
MQNAEEDVDGAAEVGVGDVAAEADREPHEDRAEVRLDDEADTFVP